MTAIEQLRANPRLLDRLNQFLTEDEVGILFLKAVTEKVVGLIPTTYAEQNHGTIFRSGFSAGAGAVLTFIKELDPITVAERLAQDAADRKLKEKQMLPSAKIAMLSRTNPEAAPKFPIPRPEVVEKLPT